MLIEKLLGLIINAVINFLIYFAKVLSPIKITPKEVEEKITPANLKAIYSLKISNRSGKDLYAVFIAGISKEKFITKIISDDCPKGKTVEHMNINTNRFVVELSDKKTGNYLWVYRIHEMDSRTTLNLKLKIENSKKVYFRILKYSFAEIPIKEGDNGIVEMPDIFPIKIPKIK